MAFEEVRMQRKKKQQKTIVLAIRNAISYIAIWQALSFLLLLLLVWVNEILDLAHLIWGLPQSPPDYMRAALASAGVILGMVVTVGHTYLQQRNIISGVLTICSYCHRIRIDQEVWQRIEQYVTGNSTIMLSHGICPECYGKVMQSVVSNIERPEPAKPDAG
jgi:hypothetical protein